MNSLTTVTDGGGVGSQAPSKPGTALVSASTPLAPAAQRGSEWTKRERETLTRLWNEGLSAEEISKQMPGRSTASIQQRAMRQSLPARGRGPDGDLVPRLPRREDSIIDGERVWKLVPRQRECLSCHNYFMSEHSGHRRCAHCDNILSQEGSFEDYSLISSTRRTSGASGY